jgi:hypothetical protein
MKCIPRFISVHRLSPFCIRLEFVLQLLLFREICVCLSRHCLRRLSGWMDHGAVLGEFLVYSLSLWQIQPVEWFDTVCRLFQRLLRDELLWRLQLPPVRVRDVLIPLRSQHLQCLPRWACDKLHQRLYFLHYLRQRYFFLLGGDWPLYHLHRGGLCARRDRLL